MNPYTHLNISISHIKVKAQCYAACIAMLTCSVLIVVCRYLEVSSEDPTARHMHLLRQETSVTMVLSERPVIFISVVERLAVELSLYLFFTN